MYKCICDRCGKEITEDTIVINDRYPTYDILVERNGYSSKNIDLCFDCARDFEKFLEDKESEE